jgi:hypothetical protein
MQFFFEIFLVWIAMALIRTKGGGITAETQRPQRQNGVYWPQNSTE